ncbi:MAG: hypothetical protein E6Q98_17910 [Rhodospirillaceae bacterium]|nr:MAG: hypothetical protein E6Q98_17910 [Rhodospirillaceae bacterium]
MSRVAIGGVGTLLVVIAWMCLFPDLFRRDTLLHEAPHAASATADVTVKEGSRSVPTAAP